MTIVTQEKELVNYAAIKRIGIYEGEYATENGRAAVFTILAFDINSDTGAEIEEDVLDEAIQLAVYADKTEAENVIEGLLRSLSGGTHIFRMPQPKVGVGV